MRPLLLCTLILCTATTLALADDDETIVVTVTAAPSSPTDEPEWVDDNTFSSAILNSTNTYRQQHNASDVSWNETLAEFAADYLDDGDCEFEHSGGPYGENLAMGYPNATASVEAWGEERDDYDFDDAEFSMETGHFTQLVWKDTTDVGCGRRLCDDGGWYLVCEYWPVGNVVDAFDEEVEEHDAGVRPRVGSWTWILAIVISFVLSF